MSTCTYPLCGSAAMRGQTRCYIHEGWPAPGEAPPEDDWIPDDNDAPDASPAQPQPQRKPETPRLKNVSELFARSIERGRLRQQGLELPVPTPWRELNDTLGGGLWPGLHALVAGTGVGKTQLCLQIASSAVTRPTPIPVGLIELELDEMQLALRILGDNAGVSWSGAYLGKLHDDQFKLLDVSAERLSRIPMYCDFGDAMSWGPKRLRAMAAAMRAAHPTGPLLLVLDFLQLVGPDDAAQGRLDLRERIGGAAYQARMVSREFGASVLVVSSTARDNYAALSSKMDRTGLRVVRSGLIQRRVVGNPDALIGTGKESGEVEYAADSVTVLMRPQLTLGSNHQEIDQLLAREGQPIVAVSAKVRAGRPSWMALGFEKGVFSSLSPEAMNSLAMSPAEQEAETSSEESTVALRAEIMMAVRDAEARGRPYGKRGAIADDIKGRRADVLDAIKDLFRSGMLSTGVDDYIHCAVNSKSTL